MAVTHYNNQDASAPTLTGQVGSMITLLDAVLVNGYGSKAAAGWTKAFSGTNIAVYRASTTGTGATGMYLRVDDTTTTHATITAYKTMSDINTGTDVIPSGTPVYSNSAVYWNKSSTANATQRIWSIIADARTFYMNLGTDSTVPSTPGAYMFTFGAGDFESYVPGQVHNYFIAGNYTTDPSTASYQFTNDQATWLSAVMGRSQELTPGKQSKFWLVNFGACAWSGSTSHFAYSAYTGVRFFYPAFIAENATQSNITGKLRGTFGFAGRSTGNWIENFGKLPDDPTGPDMIQYFNGGISGGQSVYVRLGDW